MVIEAGQTMGDKQQHAIKEHLNVFAPALVISLLGFLLAYQFVDPAPPERIRMASGHPQGAYHLFAQRYRELLAKEGIELEIVTSAGSLENIALLARGEVDIAFVQGGLAEAADGAALNSLGSFFYEPLWLFHRAGLRVPALTALRQQRIAIGEVGSGTRALALQLLADNGLHEGNSELLEIGGQEAADALLAGSVDAALFVASPRSPTVRRLLEQSSVQLMDFARADAYTRLHPHLSSVVLPEGLVDLQRNLPHRPTRLLSATANLVASEQLHPAIVELLLFVGGRIHGGGDWFEARDEFPTPAYSDFPLSADAERVYQRGPSLLQRYLPFWTASLLDRLKVMLLPLFALLIPLVKIMPAIYNWRMRARIYPWYREVLAIDRQMAAGELDVEESLSELAEIERKVMKISVPLSFAEELYDLRRHINLARQRLEAWRQSHA
ncbi:MAG: ABC transporter substrate-binding protein [Gammaproteobacteria bacterium]|nr:ABC transporter substrate-binding protein [Gammaproteobacteria bacterium]